MYYTDSRKAASQIAEGAPEKFIQGYLLLSEKDKVSLKRLYLKALSNLPLGKLEAIKGEVRI